MAIQSLFSLLVRTGFIVCHHNDFTVKLITSTDRAFYFTNNINSPHFMSYHHHHHNTHSNVLYFCGQYVLHNCKLLPLKLAESTCIAVCGSSVITVVDAIINIYLARQSLDILKALWHVILMV